MDVTFEAGSTRSGTHTTLAPAARSAHALRNGGRQHGVLVGEAARARRVSTRAAAAVEGLLQGRQVSGVDLGGLQSSGGIGG
jgi:hypothetical protein